MEQSKESKTIVKRFLDLANKSYKQNMYTFTDFLSEGDLSLFYDNIKDFGFTKYQVYGGMADTERVMICFGNEEEFGYKEEFPIACLKISPVLAKFSDELSHRDYLGALMNLGIERSVIGDIIIKEKCSYIFCKDDIKSYIIDNLFKIKHTNVRVEETTPNIEGIKREPVYKEVIVSSLRIDVIIASIYNKSRSQVVTLFREHKIFVNGRLYENNSGLIKEGDMISVRGSGRFRYEGTLRTTLKGKNVIKVDVY